MTAKKSVPADAGFVDIELARPIQIAGAAVKALRMREPTVGDQISAGDPEKGAQEWELRMLTNLCEISPDDLKKVSIRDYRKLQKAFMDFTV